MKSGELPIKSPCDADWAMMNPRKTGRFCGDCKKVVHDLSSMREADAKKRVAAAPEGLCIRYLHDEHGNVWFKDTTLVSPGSLLKKGATMAALTMMPLLTACMGTSLAVDEAPNVQPIITPPQDELDHDGGAPDARKSAEPLIGTDAGGGADAAGDAAPEPEPDAAVP